MPEPREPTAEDLDDAKALEDALAEGHPRPYAEVRRELRLADEPAQG